MKTKLFLSVLLSFIFYLLSSQIPQGFNYQAIVRNSSGDVIQSQNVKVKVAIQKFDGTVLWDEEHTLFTSQFGLVIFVVGTGPNLTGSVPDFSNIDWTAQTLYLKTYVQYPVPGSYTEMGTTQIWSVPYALRSKESEQWKTSGANIYRSSGNVGIGVTNPLSKVVVQPDASWDDGTPLFEVKNKIGVPVLAVYNNGVRILVDHTYTKGLKGGFAVGGYDQTKAGKTVDFMTISPDSIRFNINNDNAKGLKGGFAVGGYDVTGKAGINQDFMYITPQTSNNGQYNTFLGYQAGYNNGGSGLYNSFIGYNAGYGNTTGTYNVFFGYKAGAGNTYGGENTIIGYQSGLNNTGAYKNVFLGYRTGYNTTGASNGNGWSNIFIGTDAGFSNTTGAQNTFIGTEAGYSAISTGRNTYIGFQAGKYTTSALNTFVGSEAGKNVLSAGGNTFIGYHAGVSTQYGTENVCIGMVAAGSTDTHGPNMLGNFNVYIGAQAGYKHEGNRNVLIGDQAGGKYIDESTPITGSGNIFIGYMAGFEELGSDKLYIDNSGTITPLIYGDFTDGSEKLVFNGNVGIGTSTPSIKLDVSGMIRATGVSVPTSGAGLELSYSDGVAIIEGYDRSAPAQKPICLAATNVYPNTQVDLGNSTHRWSTIYAANGTINTSDIRLKTNIASLNYGLESIMKLNPVSFTWKNETDGATHLGLVAQEVESIISEVVDTGTDPDETLGINYSQLVPVLIKGMQEQQQQIESQKQENQQLKSELQTLREEVEKIKALQTK